MVFTSYAEIVERSRQADVEFPGSALGTPYPLNIETVRNRLDKNGFKKIHISTNIGEEQRIRSNS